MSLSRTGKKLLASVTLLAGIGFVSRRLQGDDANNGKDPSSNNALQLVDTGRKIFRFDTFGDEAFWGGALKLHQAIEGASQGGTGPGLSPKAAIAAGLKVDIDAIPNDILGQ